MGMCGMGKYMKLWKQKVSDACPQCGEPEDASHVWVCNQKGSSVVWDNAILRLREWLESVRTDPDLVETILLNLCLWREGHSSCPPSNNTLLAFNQQSDIGWQLFLEGCLSFEWAALQEEYYKFISSRRTGKCWAISLLKKLWQIAWELWDHRNEVLHHQENISQQHEGDQLNRSLRQLYSSAYPQLMSSKNRYLLQIPLVSLIKKPRI